MDRAAACADVGDTRRRMRTMLTCRCTRGTKPASADARDAAHSKVAARQAYSRRPCATCVRRSRDRANIARQMCARERRREAGQAKTIHGSHGRRVDRHDVSRGAAVRHARDSVRVLLRIRRREWVYWMRWIIVRGAKPSERGCARDVPGAAQRPGRRALRTCITSRTTTKKIRKKERFMYQLVLQENVLRYYSIMYSRLFVRIGFIVIIIIFTVRRRAAYAALSAKSGRFGIKT